MNKGCSTIVVGGGLIGCCAAYYLARAGCPVTLVERDRLGSGASSGNCGYVCPSHVMPLAAPGVILRTLRQMRSSDAAVLFRWSALPGMIPWLLRFASCCRTAQMLKAARGRHALLASSMQLYPELLADQALVCEWHKRGLLTVYRSARSFDQFGQTARLLQREFGLTVTPYAKKNLLNLEPALQPGLAGGWLFPGDAHVHPSKLLRALRRNLETLEVEVKEGVEVQSLQIKQRRLHSIGTSQGRMSCEVAIIATGAETPQFAKPLRCRIPIKPGKGYSLTMPIGQRSPRIPMIFEEHHVAVTPFNDALRVGSTMEFAGYDRSINPARTALLLRSARAHLAEVPDAADMKAWAGWRPMIYDGLPCIDRSPGAENVVVAAGNGMIGLASAPATGRLAAEIALSSQAHLDPTPYSLRRFGSI